MTASDRMIKLGELHGIKLSQLKEKLEKQNELDGTPLVFLFANGKANGNE